jgi:hypothetical protein
MTQRGHLSTLPDPSLGSYYALGETETA